MPELPEVERVRRILEPVMAGARFDRVILNRPDLRRPFPAGFARRLRGQTVRALGRRGKYLLAELDSRDTLVMHLGMSGWFRVEPTGAWKRRHQDPETSFERRHDHVIFTMSSGATVIFSDPRRFGVMDLVAAHRLTAHGPLERMGPEPLARGFDARALARRCVDRKVSLKAALLDQSIVAGVGNIYASEALHLARLSPFRPASSIATASGLPRPACERLTAALKAVLRGAIAADDAEGGDGRRFRVYDREGERCSTPRCRGIVRRVPQTGRSTFYCPVCQR